MTLAQALIAERPTSPRTFVFDIEVAPATARVWGLWDQNISIHQVLESPRMLCWAGKWHGERKVTFRSEFHDGREAMLSDLWDMLHEADVVVGFNHVRYDLPHVRREFLQAGMLPPSPWQDIDLLTVNRRQFRWLSNKLDWIAGELEIGRKLKTDQALWDGVLAGDEKAWAKFRAYNRQDCELTSSLYAWLEPWVAARPHAGLFTGDMTACWSCGSADLSPSGFVRSRTTAWVRLTCGCGAHSRLLDNGQTRRA